jgi:phosphate transport system substrate-binding protein
MSKNNETVILLLSVLITGGVVGGGLWLWNQMMPGSNPFQANPSPTPTSTNLGESASPTPPSVTASPTSLGSMPSSVSSGFATVTQIPRGLFTYGGSTTWAPIRRDVDPALQSAHPQFQLRYTNPIQGTPGSGKGIQMLLDNQLDFAQSSRPLENKEYEAAKARGFSLKEIPVAIDSIAIAVHPNLNIPGLTLAQLRDIYIGKITNWQQVGGADLPITAYSRHQQDGGTVEFFVNNVLDQQPFGRNVQFIYSTTVALRKLAVDPGGIYYASAPEIVGQCTVKPLSLGSTANQLVAPYQEPLVSPAECPAKRNQLNATAFQSGQYPITRRLFVIVKVNAQEDQKAGEAYANLLLTFQGQDLISKSGFGRIR